MHRVTRLPYDTPDGNPPEREQLRLFLSQHLVTFTGQIEYSKPGAAVFRDSFIYSGFLMKVNEATLWVTAGHCIAELDKLLATPHVELIESQLGDYHGHAAKHLISYPLRYYPGMGVSLDFREAGVDFGYIILDNLAATAVERNGAVPVATHNFLGTEGANFVGYFMLGVPSSLTEKDADHECTYYPQLIALKQVAPSDSEVATSESWLAFEIEPSYKGLDIKGMSGGPIGGLLAGADGNLSYTIIALQSSWDEKKGIAFACSLPHVFRFLQAVASFGERPASVDGNASAGT